MVRFKRHKYIISIVLTIITLLAISSDYVSAQKEEIRALWVHRWNYKAPADIKAIMLNASRFNFNTILFQVRGKGTVFYKSSIEPWADEIGGTDPGWDPLITAITEAHKHNLKLHAWINVYPGWSGIDPPRNPNHIWNSHPDWFMITSLATFSITLKPVLLKTWES